jgi:cysteinyl-tRNA synthetase
MSNQTHVLKLYNTETKTKQEVKKPCSGDTLSIYTCGPTVYNFAHIGNFRTYIFEDVLRRTLLFFGNKVKQVMNLTDVDDKTIKGALEGGLSLDEYTKPYIEAFFQDLKTLGVQPAEAYPAATNYIADMIKIIEKLLSKGSAYIGADKSVYFKIESFPKYGRLSHLPLCTLKAGASNRVAADEYEKDQVSDFVLWKAYDEDRDGSIFWESPFGKGRPGWHIECSAMAMNILGESIDIHVGGVDNMFPHHENEIAQSEAFSGKTFVQHWLHSEHLLVNNKKMSKSLGNFYTVRDLLEKGYLGHQIRYILLQTHYRTQLNFTLEGLEGAGVAVQRILDFADRLKEIENLNSFDLAVPVMLKCVDDFSAALADDLNISVALSALFEAIREINILCDMGKVSQTESEEVLELLDRIDEVLGILSMQDEDEVPQDLLEALEKRIQARSDKNWALADQYRNLIEERGYKIEDSPTGVKLKKQRNV